MAKHQTSNIKHPTSSTQPLLERWEQQAAMFKQFADECEHEQPPEMMKRSEYYRDLAAHKRACVRELKALLHGPE